jgi:hypothetical protein
VINNVEKNIEWSTSKLDMCMMRRQ